MTARRLITGVAVFLIFLSCMAAADERRPRIAIIIDDLGYLKVTGERVIALPGPVACAILPHTPYSRQLAMRANSAGKQVLLHLPLQPVEQLMPLGMGSIDIDNTHSQLAKILNENFDSVPHADGVNTHMGSLLTQHPGHMAWLMQELGQRGDLYFVDSYTTPSSVALRLAREHGVPATRRHVFLDSEVSWDNIAQQFARLKNRARLYGKALAIGHPYDVTLNYLERAIPQLEREGFDLVPVSELVEAAPMTTAHQGN